MLYSILLHIHVKLCSILLLVTEITLEDSLPRQNGTYLRQMLLMLADSWVKTMKRIWWTVKLLHYVGWSDIFDVSSRRRSTICHISSPSTSRSSMTVMIKVICCQSADTCTSICGWSGADSRWVVRLLTGCGRTGQLILGCQPHYYYSTSPACRALFEHNEASASTYSDNKCTHRPTG